MPRILTRLRIDEVSAVDKGAGEGVKIVLMKRRDRRDGSSKERWQRHEREWLAGRACYDRFAKIFGVSKAADGDGDDDGDRENNGGHLDHPVVDLARLLVASG